MHRTRLIAATAAAASMSIATTASGAVSITTADGQGADAHIAKWDVGGNFGGDPRVRIKNALSTPTLDFDRKGYLRFDLSTLPRRGAAAASLGLTLETNPPQGDPVLGAQVFRVYGLNDGAPGDQAPGTGGWIEGIGSESPTVMSTVGLTWNNAPANDGSADGAGPDAVLLGTFIVDGIGTNGQTVIFDDPDLLAFLEADSNGLVTLIVARETIDLNGSGWVHGFRSRESSAGPAPTLTIDTACPGDLDGDNDVDTTDLNILLSGFGCTGGGCPGDADGDGDTDTTDLNIVLSTFGSVCP